MTSKTQVAEENLEESIEQREAELEGIAGKYKPGEKGVAFFWLIFGIFFFVLSLDIYKKHPGLSGPGALPLGVTGLIILCSIFCIFLDHGKESEADGMKFAELVKNTVGNMFPVNVIVTMVLMLVYSICLKRGVGFYPTTAVFLWLCMMFFMRSKYITDGKTDKMKMLQTVLRNLLWTVVCLLFIFVVFTKLFSVVLP